MKNIITILCAIFLFNFCATAQTSNDCLIVSAQFQAVYTAKLSIYKYYFTRILILRWEDKVIKAGAANGHAACVFQVKDKLFLYDPQTGSERIPIEYKDHPLLIAYHVYGERMVKTAGYLEDLP